MIKNDNWIQELGDRMITPFNHELITKQNGHGVLSYGTSSFGYDIRLCPMNFWLFKENQMFSINPKNPDPQNLRKGNLIRGADGDYYEIPAHGLALGASVERFEIPKDVIGVILGKSTYARVGIQVIATPLEPGWQGYVTLEFVNNNPSPVRVYVLEGCCQVLFFESVTPCSTSYGDRKYQNQPQIPVLGKV